ncbi:cyclic nucleotide-binding protein [Faunimonas pinastri]|uniref:Cyclic nucleotide-binding protein n=1 Tax=Faunimonas pinastri TaxID=1855383 RepID=A0A1H9GUT2_9HYPH|nr:cyclic nucleotide-binding domain-containing protein [Faunimonas pinastri]SEQ53837.1 cyclic nucleotide-binding protein [Faunimonas pinastri]
MSLASDIDSLRQTAFFEGFPDEHLRFIALAAEPRTFRAGQRIYQAGSLIGSTYAITSGNLVAILGRGQFATRRQIGAGNLIGETALLVESRATETIEAETEVRAMQLQRAVFRRLLEEYPELARDLRAKFTATLQTALGQYTAGASSMMLED